MTFDNKKSKYDNEHEKLKRVRYNSKRDAETQGLGNGGKSWSGDDLKILFSENLTDREISSLLLRSETAIQIKRCIVVKLGEAPNDWLPKSTQPKAEV